MHPAYKSDKPGIAPDCGMQLEPVYEGEEGAVRDVKTAWRPGTVSVPAEKQQLLGVRLQEKNQ
jgi:Cu(I)/Ag(I) efflux system membrane fusion protein